MIPAIIKHPVLMINLILEACISYVNFVALLKNNNPKTNLLGKIKTGFLSATLVLAYFPNVIKIYVLIASLGTSVLQIGAFLRYRETDIIKDEEKKK